MSLPPPRRAKPVPRTALVPKDYLKGYERHSPRFQRLAVTLLVLEGEDAAAWTRSGHAYAAALWGPRLERPGLASAVSSLLYLESLGVCRNLAEDGDFYSVEVQSG